MSLTGTQLFIYAVVTVILVVDVLLRIFKGDPGTISWTIANLSQKTPLVPLAWGLLTGHLFLPNYGWCH